MKNKLTISAKTRKEYWGRVAILFVIGGVVGFLVGFFSRFLDFEMVNIEVLLDYIYQSLPYAFISVSCVCSVMTQYFYRKVKVLSKNNEDDVQFERASKAHDLMGLFNTLAIIFAFSTFAVLNYIEDKAVMFIILGIFILLGILTIIQSQRVAKLLEIFSGVEHINPYDEVEMRNVEKKFDEGLQAILYEASYHSIKKIFTFQFVVCFFVSFATMLFEFHPSYFLLVLIISIGNLCIYYREAWKAEYKKSEKKENLYETASE